MKKFFNEEKREFWFYKKGKFLLLRKKIKQYIMISDWNINSLTIEQEKQKEELAEQLKISPVLAQLLLQRGVSTEEEAKDFFHPRLDKLHDPFLMKDMDLAVDRLIRALANKERILVYGDYDVDGTTAVALVYKFLKQYHHDVDFYVPDRYNEGYGISYQGIDFAKEHGFSLVIALDCGIKAVEKVDYALSLGVDFIICDHHTPDDVLPRAVAVLDSKRGDCNYPYKHLCGCGVGFKFMQALVMTMFVEKEERDLNMQNLYRLLDFVVVSIASDIVPITGENRILAYYGLKQLNSNPSLGLRSVIDMTGLKSKEILISDIVFKIGPRINASGRMQLAREAVELLVTNNKDFAEERSKQLDEHNEQRKDLDKATTDIAIRLMELDKGLEQRKSIVIYNPSWHKGVIGIVASRISEKYYRPTVVLTRNANGIATGSARSVSGFDVYKALESCKDLLVNFGGHIYAAGLAMKEENVGEFTRRFEAYVREHIRPDQQVAQIDIDARLSFREINRKFYRVLRKFNPFGPENPKPIFYTDRVVDKGTSRLVGKENEHLKLDVVDENGMYVTNAIAFRQGQYFDVIKTKQPIAICYTIEENNFKENTTIQLMVQDIKVDL